MQQAWTMQMPLGPEDELAALMPRIVNHTRQCTSPEKNVTKRRIRKRMRRLGSIWSCLGTKICRTAQAFSAPTS